jgi:hypothetical protein
MLQAGAGMAVCGDGGNCRDVVHTDLLACKDVKQLMEGCMKPLPNFVAAATTTCVVA